MPSIGSLCVGFFDSFIFLSYNLSPEKLRFQHSTFSALKSLLLPQFSTYRYRTAFIIKRKQVCIQESLWQNYILVSFFYTFLKSSILPKKYAYFKKFHKIYYSVIFFKMAFLYTYIFTKYINNFKFSISLKYYQE